MLKGIDIGTYLPPIEFLHQFYRTNQHQNFGAKIQNRWQQLFQCKFLNMPGLYQPDD